MKDCALTKRNPRKMRKKNLDWMQLVVSECPGTMLATLLVDTLGCYSRLRRRLRVVCCIS